MLWPAHQEIKCIFHCSIGFTNGAHCDWKKLTEEFASGPELHKAHSAQLLALVATKRQYTKSDSEHATQMAVFTAAILYYLPPCRN